MLRDFLNFFWPFIKFVKKTGVAGKPYDCCVKLIAKDISTLITRIYKNKQPSRLIEYISVPTRNFGVRN